jgi:hypothetical protein
MPLCYIRRSRCDVCKHHEIAALSRIVDHATPSPPACEILRTVKVQLQVVAQAKRNVPTEIIDFVEKP